MRPYLAIDIETTGLEIGKAKILEIGAVIDDGVSSIDKLPRISCVIQHESFNYSTPYAMWLNRGLLEQIAKKEGTVSHEYAMKSLCMLTTEASEIAAEWDEKRDIKPNYRVQIAGKNAGSFDIPIIENNMDDYYRHSFQIKRQHRVIDVGSMYFKDFGYVPSLEDIKIKIGLGHTVAHRALEDALDVVRAIRAKC